MVLKRYWFIDGGLFPTHQIHHQIYTLIHTFLWPSLQQYRHPCYIKDQIPRIKNAF